MNCYVLEESAIKGALRDAELGELVPYCQSTNGFYESNGNVSSRQQIDRSDLFRFFRSMELDGLVALFQRRQHGVTTYYFVRLSEASRNFLGWIK